MDGTVLSNRAGVTLTGTWILPDIGTNGPVQNTATDLYLSTNGETAAGSEVVEEAVDEDDDDQKWERSAEDGSGYFTLKNPTSGMYLTMKTVDTLTIGKTQFFCVVVFIPCCFFTYRCYEWNF